MSVPCIWRQGGESTFSGDLPRASRLGRLASCLEGRRRSVVGVPWKVPCHGCRIDLRLHQQEASATLHTNQGQTFVPTASWMLCFHFPTCSRRAVQEIWSRMVWSPEKPVKKTVSAARTGWAETDHKGILARCEDVQPAAAAACKSMAVGNLSLDGKYIYPSIRILWLEKHVISQLERFHSGICLGAPCVLARLNQSRGDLFSCTCPTTTVLNLGTAEDCRGVSNASAGTNVVRPGSTILD